MMSMPKSKQSTETELQACQDRVQELAGQLAKIGFVNLQDANDRGDLEAIRNFTNDEMFESLRTDMVARGGAKQQTDIVTLNASLLEVATEGAQHWASVRFHGSMREQENQPPQAFEEVWHLQKPVQGGSGWLLSGIQQVS